MHLTIFKNVVIAGKTYVICPQKAEDMDEGWDDTMDALVGVPMLVRSKGSKSVEAGANGLGPFIFGYRYVEIVDTEKRKIKLNDSYFLIAPVISIYTLDNILLSSDRSAVRKLANVKIGEGFLDATQEVLEDIQKSCPRVIGALLSYNLMERAR